VSLRLDDDRGGPQTTVHGTLGVQVGERIRDAQSGAHGIDGMFLADVCQTLVEAQAGDVLRNDDRAAVVIDELEDLGQVLVRHASRRAGMQNIRRGQRKSENALSGLLVRAGERIGETAAERFVETVAR
jgi:hypothetical protein